MMTNLIRRAGVLGATLALSALTVSALSAVPAEADTGSTPISQSTVTGVHNTYNPADYPYLAQALDAGTSMLVLDTWTDVFSNEWKVSNEFPTVNTHNSLITAT